MTTKQISKYYILLNGINDVAYFGFMILQFLLLEPALRALLPESQAAMSIGLTMTLITSQLLFQILAEGPTGAVADLYGRVRAVALSFWCRLIAITLVLVCVLVDLRSSPAALTLTAVAAALILAQVLIATGEAFLEGSIEAWLCNESKISAPENYEEVINKTFERSAIVQNVAILVTVTSVLVAWQFWGRLGGIVLATLAGLLFLVGAVISHSLFKRERFKGNKTQQVDATLGSQQEPQRAHRAIAQRIRVAFASVISADGASIRRLIAILVLPFPCWIILSWFFTTFAQPSGSDGTTDISGSFTLWVGFTLGVARVLGASIGKWLGRHARRENLQSVFEKAVFVNILFLFGAAMLLVLRLLVEGALPSSVGVVLFLSSVAVAKGSEEVIKLSKNKFLAFALPDDDIRATTLSLVSVAQNAFAFVAIFLSGLVASRVTLSSLHQPAIIFAACASAGIAGWLIWSREKVLLYLLR